MALLLQENAEKNRYTLFPILYPDMYAAFIKATGSFWRAEEINFSHDRDDFNKKLNDDERYFLSMVLAFFAASDGIVNENLATDFMTKVQIPEAKSFYAFQIAMESIHGQTYSLLIETLVKSDSKKAELFNAIETIPCVKKKADWALKWINHSSMDETTGFLTRLIAFACVEGIFFSGSFCAIFWLKERGIMPGLCTSNEFISRDENMHTQFACMLYRKYVTTAEKLPTQMVLDIVNEAVNTELEFVCDALPVSLLGMNSHDMSEYIKFIANRLLEYMGINVELYPGVKNPFPFMNRISLENKTNFFEGDVSEYTMNNHVSLDEKKAFEPSNTDIDF
jgi:ribonucleoside-diphosphate reductase beta chain